MTSLYIYARRFCTRNPPINFYVYAYLRNDGKPYYIGKGKGTRAWAKHGSLPVPNNERIVILESNLSEIGAWALERRLIEWFGRIHNKTGILQNISKGGPYGASTPGKPKSQEHKRKISESLRGKPRIYNSPGTLGRIWVNNGSINKCVLPNEIPEGFSLGSLRQTFVNSVQGMTLYNNGKESKYFKKDTQPPGWVLGRCKK